MARLFQKFQEKTVGKKRTQGFFQLIIEIYCVSDSVYISFQMPKHSLRVRVNAVKEYYLTGTYTAAARAVSVDRRTVKQYVTTFEETGSLSAGPQKGTKRKRTDARDEIVVKLLRGEVKDGFLENR